MIDRQEVLDIAGVLGLLPHVVEKDYVLGWVLAGIHQHAALEATWIFKGGTCLKKCYFETYRFSEDLDFTITDPRQIDHEFLATAFREIGEWIYERTGIEIPEGLQEFDLYDNPRGTVSCQGKLGYRGPISPRSGNRNLPRIKLDLTPDELLVLPPVKRFIFHDYSDAPEEGIAVRCYAYEEAFAEKVRALGDRVRPRDLYDVINLYRNTEARPQPTTLHDVLQKKCAHRDIPTPTLARLEVRRGELEGSWQSMLGHQLQTLPSVESFWNALSEFFAWLETGTAPPVPTRYRIAEGETVLRERTLRLPVGKEARSYLEIIRFAAAHHLCVDLTYNGTVRRIEPYSLRRTLDGNIILHATRTLDDEHRSYRVDRIQGAQATRQGFVPQYAVELSPHDPLVVPPTPTRLAPLAGGRKKTRASPWRRERASRSDGLRHIYECGHCGRLFTRKKMTSRLNPHKDKFGSLCPGRMAIHVDTRY